MKKIVLSIFIFLGIFINPKDILAANNMFGCRWNDSAANPAGWRCEIWTQSITCSGNLVPDASVCESQRNKSDCLAKQDIPCVISTTVPAARGFDPTCDTYKNPDGTNAGISTALGCLPTDPQAFVGLVIPWAVGIGGGVAFLLMLYGVFMIIVSSGVPDKMQAGRELITSAITGLLIIVFAVFILKFIGVDVLQLF